MNVLLRSFVKKAAKTVLAVEDLNDEQLEKFRIETCNGCENLDPEDRTCKLCGCFMDVKTKLLTARNPKKDGRIEFVHCEAGFWNDSHIPKINELIYQN